jgi:hypothetical protein
MFIGIVRGGRYELEAVWNTEARPDRLIIRAIGRLKLDESTSAAREFVQALGEVETPVALIIDLSGLAGYDAPVRRCGRKRFGNTKVRCRG